VERRKEKAWLTRLTKLLKEIKDQRLKGRLSAAVANSEKTKKFGLVFEEHLPELLRSLVPGAQPGARRPVATGGLTDTFIVRRVVKGLRRSGRKAGTPSLRTCRHMS